MRILITGGCGFVGHHLVEHLLQSTGHELVVMDSLTYAGRTDRLTDMTGYDPDRVDLVWHDLRAPIWAHLDDRIGHVDAVLHLASESHVDRSITDPVPFVHNNVDATLTMLEWARTRKLSHFVQVSTDEVYGPAAEDQSHAEWSPIIPSNPYSASKAAQEALGIAYWRTYDVPVVITNNMNVIGERQDCEKIVPKAIRALILNEPVPIHADANNIPGSRFYLHARNIADAWRWLLENTRPDMYPERQRPSRWNIVGDEELDNLELVNIIGGILGIEPKVKFIDFHQARPGHDRRYALDGSKIRSAGWKPPVELRESLRRTVWWSVNHPEWLGLRREDVQHLQGRQTA